MQKVKICKKCQWFEDEIARREGLLDGITEGTAGYVSTQILHDKHTRLLA
jgi:hypothetical protein